MRPLRLVALNLQFVTLCVALAVVLLASGATASTAEPAAGTTFALASPGPCTAPAKVLGRACANTAGAVLHTNWTFGDGSAQWNVPGEAQRARGSHDGDPQA